MKRKILILLSGFAIVAAMAFMSSGEDIPLSSGAPVGSTNAPGELTCGKAGCHTGANGANNINTGAGVLSVTSPQDMTRYMPGATYDITVMLEETGVERFGFSLTALDEQGNKAGTLIVTDHQRTQIFNGSHQFANREYMTYRMAGTNPYQQGKGKWTFQWRVPDEPAGKVTFYLAGVSANNDATDDGDLVYTQTMSSMAVAADIASTEREQDFFTVYPNPVKDKIRIRLNSTDIQRGAYTLYNVNGNNIKYVNGMYNSTLSQEITIPVEGLPGGVYFLRLGNGNKQATTKIFLAH